jgi:3-oxoacyl-[acyl-carrier protein] reductase
VNYSSSKAGADAVVDRITKRGGRAVAVQANVATQADIDRLFAETKQAFGKLDILVNNAGIYAFSPLENVTAESFHAQFNLNVLGLLLTTQKAVAAFGPEGGSIVNISSVAGTDPVPGASIYCGTKGAVDAITKSLSKELGPRKIRVNSLNPGMIETEGVREAGFLGTDFHKTLEAQTPLGRIGQPDDIGPVAVFLASDDSRWVTGETVRVSGGQH